MKKFIQIKLAGIGCLALIGGCLGVSRLSHALESAVVVESGQPAKEQKVSEVEPSTDFKMPAPLALREVVTGRLTGAADPNHVSHYWAVNLPAGAYKAVVDTKSVSGKRDAQDLTLAWVGIDGVNVGELGGGSDGFYRSRFVVPFQIKNGAAATVKCEFRGYFNTSEDYWLAIVPANEHVKAPFFAANPNVQHVELGQEATASLEDPALEHMDAHWLMDLPAGAYKVSVRYAADPAHCNYQGGTIDLLSVDGAKVSTILEKASGGAKPELLGTGKFILPRGATVYLRARAYDSPENVFLTVDRWPDQ